MTARKVFSLIVMCLLVFLLINMFIPLIGNSMTDYSLWDYYELVDDDPLKIIVIIEIIKSTIHNVKETNKIIWIIL